MSLTLSGSTALYNRWRSRSFANPDDLPLIGQDHVTRTLRNAVASGQVAHAYLFCGPRGTGKTSAARILARAVNCKRGLQGEPCNECENCQALLSGRQLDLLIEIDGASNRGVDDVRALRERLMQRPGGADLTGRFKVYIIDEVHMLTTEAFNALLKSLEEPPPHVIFILCTTDPQKVPATVASRCQRFDFKPIPFDTLVKHLARVASAERVEIEPAALELLARTAAGGARDAVSLLDQALAYAGAVTDGADSPPKGGKGGRTKLRITAVQVQAMLGLTDFEAVCGLVDAIVSHDLPAALRLVQQVVSQGSDLRQFARQVIEFLRGALLLAGRAGDLASLDDETREQVRLRAERLGLAETVRLIKLFTQAEHGLRSPAAQPQLPLELAVVEATFERAAAGEAAPRSENPTPAPAPPPAAPSEKPAPPRPRRIAAEPSIDDAPHPAETLSHADPPATDASESAPVEREPEPAQVPAPLSPRARSAEIRERPTSDAAEAVTLETVKSKWRSVVEAVRKESRNLASMLELAEPVAVESGNAVVAQCRFAIHATKLQDPANSIAIGRALSRALGVRATVRCEASGGGSSRANHQRSIAASDDPAVTKVARMLNARMMTPAELEAMEAMPLAAEFEPFSGTDGNF